MEITREGIMTVLQIRRGNRDNLGNISHSIFLKYM